MVHKIPLSEFQERVTRTQEAMRQRGLDVLLAYGNEAEPQYVRYYSNYWPSFETSGVLIPAEGSAVLLIGPESYTYASDRSVIPEIRLLKAFRESSEPEYPGKPLDTFEHVFQEFCGAAPKRLGVAGLSLMTIGVYNALAETLQKIGCASIEKADDIVNDLRMIKTENELACMKEAARITAAAFDYVIENMRPGMTESQVVGLALGKIHELGAERESYPFWVLAGEGGDQAISRARHKVIQPGELVHLQFGARYEGYASSIGRQIVFGKAADWQKELIQAGYTGRNAVIAALKAGVPAREVAETYVETMRKIGYDKYLLYGPCHGNGLMEGEAPWIESDSTWILKENMTFCVDIFLGNTQTKAGLRVEDVVCVKNDGAINLTDYPTKIFEL